MNRFIVGPNNEIRDTARPLHGRPSYCGRFRTHGEAVAVVAEVNAKSASFPRYARFVFGTLRTWC